MFIFFLSISSTVAATPSIQRPQLLLCLHGRSSVEWHRPPVDDNERWQQKWWTQHRGIQAVGGGFINCVELMVNSWVHDHFRWSSMTLRQSSLWTRRQSIIGTRDECQWVQRFCQGIWGLHQLCMAVVVARSLTTGGDPTPSRYLGGSVKLGGDSDLSKEKQGYRARWLVFFLVMVVDGEASKAISSSWAPLGVPCLVTEKDNDVEGTWTHLPASSSSNNLGSR